MDVRPRPGGDPIAKGSTGFPALAAPAGGGFQSPACLSHEPSRYGQHGDLTAAGLMSTLSEIGRGWVSTM